MKSTLVLTGMLAAAFSSLTANACLVQVHVACPNDRTAAGIVVCIAGVDCVPTDSLGIAAIHVPSLGTYTICVDTTTLPQGAKLVQNCQVVNVIDYAPPVVEFVLSGNQFCSTPPPPGPCWLTGGGTIGGKKGQPDFSYGGVVYPGCAPEPADGGNWNVVQHTTGYHFMGQHIVVDGCSGIHTKSPKVDVNIIDFHGDGVVDGLGSLPVTFVGRAIDNLEPGGGADQLFLSVVDANNNVIMQIGNSVADPATTATGNLQIHTSSCNN